tara:strand:- start:1821 stop:2438 length:618 start_codon:yes stop_codon:yes gene_type:complete
MNTIQLDSQGLVPAIAQHAETGEVLMLGYMNEGSLHRTLEGEEVWFYSRSQSDLWHKGEISGNYLRVKSAYLDCDGDTILLKVIPDGPTCHTGKPSCFFTVIESEREFISYEKGSGVLEELFSVIQDRKNSPVPESYTSELFNQGAERVAQKVVEEAGEVAIAGVTGKKEELASEVADLLYHTLVLMSSNDIKPEAVWSVLRNRR